MPEPTERLRNIAVDSSGASDFAIMIRAGAEALQKLAKISDTVELELD